MHTADIFFTFLHPTESYEIKYSSSQQLGLVLPVFVHKNKWKMKSEEVKHSLGIMIYDIHVTISLHTQFPSFLELQHIKLSPTPNLIIVYI